MKTLKHHTLLYDTNCPLCAAYTKGFICSGMLDEQGRIPYEKGIEEYGSIVDTNRSRNEIALVNTKENSVLYGVDGLSYVITQRFPVLKSLLNHTMILFFLKKLYAFISFNRKVIVPSSNYTTQVCVPDFNFSCRILYLVLSAVFTSAVLSAYSVLLQDFIPASGLYREYVVCFGQIAFQGILLLCLRTSKTQLFDYFGNMMTVFLVGGLLLLPLLLLSHYIVVAGSASLIWFFAVVAFMFFEHRKRVHSIQAPVWLSYTWVLYRCLVMLFIF